MRAMTTIVIIIHIRLIEKVVKTQHQNRPTT